MSLKFTLGAPEFLVNTWADSDQHLPVVTSLPNGNFVIAWESYATPGDDSSLRIAGQMYDPAGGKIGSEFLVNTKTAGLQGEPAITVIGTGDFVIVWQDEHSTIRAQRFDSAGVKAGPEIQVNDAPKIHQIAPVVSGSGNGFVVAWQDGINEDASPNIMAQLFDLNGVKLGAQFLVNTQTNASQTDPSAAGLTVGGFVITWTDSSGTLGDADRTSIKGQLYNSFGVPRGGEFLVNGNSAGLQQHSSVTALTNGGFVVTWDDRSGTLGDGDIGVHGQVFDFTGMKVGAEFLVNATTNFNQEDPDVVALPGDCFIVAWTDESHTLEGVDHEIRAQVFNSQGARVGEEFLINTTHGGDQTNVSISRLDNGDVVLTWWDWNPEGDGSGHSIKARLLELVPDPSLDIVATGAVKAEGNAGVTAFTFTVTRSGDTSEVTTVDWTVTGAGGTPAVGADFQGGVLPSGQTSFAIGETSKTITVNIVADTSVEQNEDFTVSLSNPSGTARVNTPSANGQILNDDVAAGRAISTGSGADLIVVGTGANNTTNGADTVAGGSGNDTVAAGGGADRVDGGAGSDRLDGQDGDDYLFAGAGWDTVDGGAGADELIGDAGDDRLAGGLQNDVLFGGSGADWLSGDQGDDTLSGGAGADIFHSFGQAGIDRILDFDRGQGDRIQLDPGSTYSLSQAGADTIVAINGGAQVVLVGVSMASLTGGWIFTA